MRYTHWYQCIYLINIPKPVKFDIYVMAFSFDLRCESVIFNSYAMGKSGLLDVYTQSLRATDTRAEGIYVIYQGNHKYPWYNYYVTLLSTNITWARAKLLKTHS